MKFAEFLENLPLMLEGHASTFEIFRILTGFDIDSEISEEFVTVIEQGGIVPPMYGIFKRLVEEVKILIRKNPRKYYQFFRNVANQLLVDEKINMTEVQQLAVDLGLDIVAIMIINGLYAYVVHPETILDRLT